MSTSKRPVRQGDLVTEVVDRAESMNMTTDEFMVALSYLAGYDPDAVGAALDAVEASQLPREDR